MSLGEPGLSAAWSCPARHPLGCRRQRGKVRPDCREGASQTAARLSFCNRLLTFGDPRRLFLLKNSPPSPSSQRTLGLALTLPPALAHQHPSLTLTLPSCEAWAAGGELWLFWWLPGVPLVPQPCLGPPRRPAFLSNISIPQR